MNTFTKYATATTKTTKLYPIGTVPCKMTMTNTSSEPAYNTTLSNHNTLSSIDGIKYFPTGMKEWIQLPITTPNCEIYAKEDLYNAAINTSLKYKLTVMSAAMDIYRLTYNANIRGYITGFTDVNNFQIKADVYCCNPFKLIMYFEDGLLNIVTSYNK